MKAQAASLPFTPVFATLVSIINTKLPMIGELLLHRLISQFRRAFKRNDKVRGGIVVSYTVNLYTFPDGLSFNDDIHRTFRQPRRCPRVDWAPNSRPPS